MIRNGSQQIFVQMFAKWKTGLLLSLAMSGQKL